MDAIIIVLIILVIGYFAHLYYKSISKPPKLEYNLPNLIQTKLSEIPNYNFKFEYDYKVPYNSAPAISRTSELSTASNEGGYNIFGSLFGQEIAYRSRDHLNNTPKIAPPLIHQSPPVNNNTPIMILPPSEVIKPTYMAPPPVNNNTPIMILPPPEAIKPIEEPPRIEVIKPTYTLTKSNTVCPTYALTDTNVDNTCLENIWSSVGCPNKIDMTTNGNWWRSQTLDTVIKDMNAWATGQTDKHRSLCYGPDTTKWPGPKKSNTLCPTYALTDIVSENSCLERLWAGAGCPNKIDMAATGNWWRSQTLDTVIKDMNAWASGSSDKHRSLCYGSDVTKWPYPKSNTLCPTYALTDPVAEDSCRERLWKAAGCGAGLKVSEFEAGWKSKTLSDTIRDINNFGTNPDPFFRSRCYGTDKTKWPK